MLRFILLALLLILVARAFWRLVDGMIEAYRGLPPSGGSRRAPAVRLVRDPVCGTHVPPRADLSLTASGTTHYFCSVQCLREYKRQA